MRLGRVNLLLALVAVALAGLVYAEVALLPRGWLSANADGGPRTEPPAPAPVLRSTAWELPAGDLPNIGSLDETINRPLFIAGRRQPSDAPQVEAAAPEPPAPPSPLPQLTLTAIVVSGDEPRAYALNQAEAGLRMLTEGDDVEGWRVAAIEADGLELQLRGRSERVDLRPPAPPAPPPPARRAKPKDGDRDERARLARETARRKANLEEEAASNAIDEEELREIEELEAAIEEQERELRELEADQIGSARLRQQLRNPRSQPRSE